MASIRFARGIVHHSATLGVLGPSLRLQRSQLSQRILNLAVARSSSSTATTSTVRRRRRRGGKSSDSDEPNANQRLIPDDPSVIASASSSAVFAPKDSDGNLLDSQEYLSLASMSPWVPCPDVVIKRVFEIAQASPNDTHVDLGCGDGRLNFAAVGGPYNVSKSWGVDVDPNILEKCRERLGKRFVPATAGFGRLGGNNKKDESSEADKLEFMQGDLQRVIERQKEVYQREQVARNDGSPSTSVARIEDGNEEDWSKEDDITQKLSQSTVVTMYFVHDALQQLQPYLASTLGGKEDVRLITVGYEMKGWEASWVERVLGLTIFKYDMKNCSSDPFEWQVVKKGDRMAADISKINGNGNNTASPDAPPHALEFNGSNADVDESSPLGKYLKQKREQDMEDLEKLQIHHDEKLNDFAGFRSKREAQHGGNGNSSAEVDSSEDDWDFEESENPEELMMEAQKAATEARMGARGKGMMAGLDTDKKKKQNGVGKKKGAAKSSAKSDAKPKPVWKKP